MTNEHLPGEGKRYGRRLYLGYSNRKGLVF